MIDEMKDITENDSPAEAPETTEAKAMDCLPPDDAVKIDEVSLAAEEQGHKITLKESTDSRGALEMFIGSSEFAAIAKELGMIQPARPLTHEIYFSLLRDFDLKFTKLEIYDVKENAYLARLFVTKNDQPETIEIRPSDGIALALHTDTPIWLNKRLLKGTLSDKDHQTFTDLVKTVRF